MANFSKLRKYQAFVLIELNNLGKGHLVDGIFKCYVNSYVYCGCILQLTSFPGY